VPVAARPMLSVPPKAIVPPPEIPVEVEMVMEELTKSLLPIRPLNKLPPAVERTGRAALKLAIVVEPFEATVNKEAPVLEEIFKGFKLPVP
jgi:hypothetical protein